MENNHMRMNGYILSPREEIRFGGNKQTSHVLYIFFFARFLFIFVLYSSCFWVMLMFVINDKSKCTRAMAIRES